LIVSYQIIDQKREKHPTKEIPKKEIQKKKSKHVVNKMKE